MAAQDISRNRAPPVMKWWVPLVVPLIPFIIIALVWLVKTEPRLTNLEDNVNELKAGRTVFQRELRLDREQFQAEINQKLEKLDDRARATDTRTQEQLGRVREEISRMGARQELILNQLTILVDVTGKKHQNGNGLNSRNGQP